MAQQTAVKWLINYVTKEDGVFTKGYILRLLEQAKAMEKEQIMKAYDDGAIDTMQEEEGLDISIDQIGEESEKYYNLNYNK